MNVQGPDGQGVYTGKVAGLGQVTFGRVKEPPAWRFGDQYAWFSQKYWWLKAAERRRQVFIFREQPREGRELNLDDAVAEKDEDYLTY